MGAVRHRQLIQGLSFLVAMNLAVGIVALAVRSDDRRERRTLAAGSVAIPIDPDNTGILAGGSFSNRRGSGSTSAPTSAQQPSSTTNTTAFATPGTAASPTTGRPAATTGSSGPAPTSPVTPTTQRPPGTSPPSTAATTSTTGRATSTTKAPPATTATSGPAAGGGQPGASSLTDPAGDTTVDGTSDPIKEGRADIVRAGAYYTSNQIILAMQLAQPTDPRTDSHWTGDSTFASWSLDTNGDGKSDYDVQFFFDEGQIGGTVSRPGSNGPDVLCDVTQAAYNADGYGVTVDPSCVGNPASFTYRLEMNYDTNPKDENADVAFDATPNGGWSFPVARPH